MLKFNLTLLLLSTALFSLFAQIPEGYYDDAEGLSGNELKTALYNIIKGHTEYPYTSSSTDVWDILKETDRDPSNPDNVILFYTGWSVNAAQEYNSGSGWNREHVWAKSRGDFGTDMGPGTDCHHIRPCDISVNSARNNRWFDECSTPYLDNGVETGCYTSYDIWVWQPRDAVKGDVARMIFYMATRYEGENGEPDLRVIDYLPEDDDTEEPVHAKLDVLLKWNEEDPVDDFERNRNEVVYSYQHNRNPFVDHPEYVDKIWKVTTSTASVAMEPVDVHVYPNPSTGCINVDNPKGLEITVYSIAGTVVKKTSEHIVHITGVTPGIYLVRVAGDENMTIETMKVVVK
ncbi:MAG: T9SS type A sorting domain-containing protein [Chlorobi bacterium]|nr:T9SS type A sorting domain-containing protein [Chlorobiota bacterium]